MRLSGIKCEMCEKQHIFDKANMPFECEMPTGWLLVYAENPRYTEGWHFCSHSCLRQWLETRTETKEVAE